MERAARTAGAGGTQARSMLLANSICRALTKPRSEGQRAGGAGPSCRRQIVCRVVWLVWAATAAPSSARRARGGSCSDCCCSRCAATAHGTHCIRLPPAAASGRRTTRRQQHGRWLQPWISCAHPRGALATGNVPSGRSQTSSCAQQRPTSSKAGARPSWRQAARGVATTWRCEDWTRNARVLQCAAPLPLSNTTMARILVLLAAAAVLVLGTLGLVVGERRAGNAALNMPFGE